MKFDQLEARYQRYVLTLSTKTKFIISGEEKQGIMQSQNQFLELRSGEIINKSFIVSILKDHERTKDALASLPEEERKLLSQK